MDSSVLFDNFIAKSGADREITGLSIDSRKVDPGDAFFCLPGSVHDGHEFIGRSVESGAVCIVYSKDLSAEEMPGAASGGVLYIRVKDTVEALNLAAKKFFGSPSEKLFMYGVTGTNGKSTIASVLHWIKGSETPCGYIGTISIEYGNVCTEPDLTTPNPIFLQKTLSDMVKSGMKACALEVSSQGLAQHRVDGIDFDAVIFTNLTHDHLDYHKTMDAYFDAKSLLFSERVKPDGVSVLNIDEPRYEQLKACSRARTVSYGVERECDYRAQNIELLPQQTKFDLLHNGKTYKVETNLLAMYNVYNLLASIAALAETGSDIEKVIAAARDLPQVKGRLEQISLGQDFHVIVDYAHTPDGMYKIMDFGRKAAGNHKLIVVFGSAGLRDKAKRRTFGEITDKYCDYIVVTEEDPRTESAVTIGQEIISGIKNTPHTFIEDRESAIRYAIGIAHKGDTVMILGKGDEKYCDREHGHVFYKGDNVIAAEVLRGLQKS
ncbi:MAG: UDP-N-acetylmuramoyl-L-alanyl-D-glutamate--2,6-diaminopimelate ligase [Eubacterium sp.]